ncbi:hypothetical protein Tco_0583319 [Tanacetum coccineum]
MLRPLKPIPLVGIGEPEGSDDYTEVPFDDDQILRQHNIAHVTPPAYTLSLPTTTHGTCNHPPLMGKRFLRALLSIPFDLEDLRACFQSSNHVVSDHFHDYILGILNPDNIYI